MGAGNFFNPQFAPGFQYVFSGDLADFPDASQFPDGTQGWSTDYNCPVRALAGRWVIASAIVANIPVPLVKLPSFTGGADGAITLATDIDYAWPHAYGFFDADVLESGSPAGWYYCQFTSTTEGVVYNNQFTPTPGALPIIPETPTAFVDPIVGGDGYIGAIDFCVAILPPMLSGNRFTFGGFIKSTLDSEVQVDIAETSLFGFTVNNYAQLEGLAAVMVDSVATLIFGGLGTVEVDVDMSVYNNVTFSMNFLNIDAVGTLAAYQIEVDTR